MTDLQACKLIDDGLRSVHEGATHAVAELAKLRAENGAIKFSLDTANSSWKLVIADRDRLKGELDVAVCRCNAFASLVERATEEKKTAEDLAAIFDEENQRLKAENDKAAVFLESAKKALVELRRDYSFAIEDRDKECRLNDSLRTNNGWTLLAAVLGWLGFFAGIGISWAGKQ